MPDGLHERDILDWAEKQAALLRRLVRGEPAGEAVDWPNVIQEIRDVGVAELRACEGLLRQALVHLLKLRAWPSSMAAAHWRGETVGFLADAGRRFTPSMRARIQLDALYDAALRQVRAEAGGEGPSCPLPEACPFTLDELLEGRTDPARPPAR